MSPIGIFPAFGRIRGYQPIYQNRQNSMAPVERVSRPETTAVPPVAKLAPVSREDGRFAQASQDNSENSVQFPTLREGADPAEMAVRGRIRYLEGESAQLLAGQKAPEAEGDQVIPGLKDLEAEEDQAIHGLKDPNAEEEDGVQEEESPQETMEEAECQTCKDRKYQDGSDDPGVSFKTPTKMSPEQAASAVRGHEQEHVIRERAKAQEENRKVVSQSVTLHTAICPECGDVYVSGGTTRTTTKAAQAAEIFNQSESQQKKLPGSGGPLSVAERFGLGQEENKKPTFEAVA